MYRLWTYRDDLGLSLLDDRLRRMGVMSEWKAFGALAVEWLGMPVEAMPFYSSSALIRWKLRRILAFVLETGNFGHNRNMSYQRRHPNARRRINGFAFP